MKCLLPSAISLLIFASAFAFGTTGCSTLRSRMEEVPDEGKSQWWFREEFGYPDRVYTPTPYGGMWTYLDDRTTCVLIFRSERLVGKPICYTDDGDDYDAKVDNAAAIKAAEQAMKAASMSPEDASKTAAAGGAAAAANGAIMAGSTSMMIGAQTFRRTNH